jgi:cyclophilin family peptidyl-prolyl cis-trans isomerase
MTIFSNTTCKTLLLILFIFSILSCGKKERIPVVIISTEYGDMTLVLSDKTPKHTANFVKNIKAGLYDSITFHRVVYNLIIQAGDPSTRSKNPKKIEDNTLIPAEFHEDLFHKKGALAAARHDNPAKSSDPTQFYIVHGKKLTDKDLNIAEGQMGRYIPKDQREEYKKVGGVPHLDQYYTVFGEVIDGLNVIDVVASSKVNEREIPLKDIILTVRLDTISR